ncbi:colanic acid/amylovoran biosynthesis glycosyltransferase [Pontibacter aydingkolensis]|uniref:Glycosyltransferase n=1 Tax=Pontibacter aydingkolensis TaxID=1911536 RepID=A0ABS7CP54_9BACT|nr:glycosyltransferase [Pontibacter aydingkolensis]MBW7465604.1 glycosyltransferase [Pontibacter aydingkolensis]
MKLKIAYSISYFPALSETYLLNQLAPLFTEGHDVTIFSIGQPQNWTRHAVIEKHDMLSKTVYRPYIPKSKFRRAAKALGLFLANYRSAKYLLPTLNFIKYGKYALSLDFFYDTIPFLNDKQFDIVHCHFGPNAIKALNFRELGLLQGELITSFHGYDVNHQEFLSWQSHASRKGLYKDLVKVCKLYTVNSLYIKQKAIKLGIPESCIKYLPEGFESIKFTPDSRSKTAAPVMLTVARLTEFKGLKYSIQAVANLLPAYPNLQYHILGEGEQRQVLEQLIKERNLTEHVFLHGAATQEQVLEYYNKAAIFVLAGVQDDNGEVEAQGLVVQEAQSMGLPLVVTDAGGIPEGMLSGKSGFVVPQKDVQAISGKIDYLLAHPHIGEEMGKVGRAYVKQNFDNQVLHQRLMSLYYGLLNKDQLQRSAAISG